MFYMSQYIDSFGLCMLDCVRTQLTLRRKGSMQKNISLTEAEEVSELRRLIDEYDGGDAK